MAVERVSVVSWGAYGPSHGATEETRPREGRLYLRWALAASALCVAIVVLAMSQGSEGTVLSVATRMRGMQAQAAFESPVMGPHFSRPRGEPACATCMASILNENKPWKTSLFDAGHALSCASEGSCAAQVLAAGGSHRSVGNTMSLAASEAAALGPSKEQLAYDAKQLDREQLTLNWNRARVFARYFGAPDAKKQDLVLADWVVPLDTMGRPVPAWLAFQPTSVVGTQQLAELPAAASPARRNATDATSALAAHAAEEQARNTLAIKNLVALAKLTYTLTALSLCCSQASRLEMSDPKVCEPYPQPPNPKIKTQPHNPAPPHTKP